MKAKNDFEIEKMSHDIEDIRKALRAQILSEKENSIAKQNPKEKNEENDEVSYAPHIFQPVPWT